MLPIAVFEEMREFRNRNSCRGWRRERREFDECEKHMFRTCGRAETIRAMLDQNVSAGRERFDVFFQMFQVVFEC